MQIQSGLPSSALTTPATPAATNARGNSTLNDNYESLPFIGSEPSEFADENTVGQSVNLALQSIFSQPNLALASQGGHSPATVFSLLQD